ncbi:MAG: hypothetical protein JW909_04760 [Planctomycetes bacterium]|nr:hypothetical protein [Planctomycetota bacterium]
MGETYEKEKDQPDGESGGEEKEGEKGKVGRPPDRKSTLMWLLVAVALGTAAAVLMGRPYVTYRMLKASEPGGRRDTLIIKCHSQGPVGTELARRYMGGEFRRDRTSGTHMAVKHQSLFIGLPLVTMKKYLGEADSETEMFAKYRVGEDNVLSIQVKYGVVQALYYDKAVRQKGGVAEKKRPEPPMWEGPLGEQGRQE